MITVRKLVFSVIWLSLWKATFFFTHKLDQNTAQLQLEQESSAPRWHHCQQRCPTFGISEPHWKKKSCLGPPIKHIVTCNHTKKSHTLLSKFTILCWATFIAILGHMQPQGLRLDTPGLGASRFFSCGSRKGIKQQSSLHRPCAFFKGLHSDVTPLEQKGPILS